MIPDGTSSAQLADDHFRYGLFCIGIHSRCCRAQAACRLGAATHVRECTGRDGPLRKPSVLRCLALHRRRPISWPVFFYPSLKVFETKLHHYSEHANVAPLVLQASNIL